MARTPTVDVVANVRHAAGRVLAEIGYERLTLRAVATEAGVSPQVIYNRFGHRGADRQASRDAILDDVAVAGFRRLIDRIMGLDPGHDHDHDHDHDLDHAPLPSIADPLRAVTETFRRHRAFATAEPELHRFLFDGLGVGFEPSPRAGEARQEVLDLFAAVTANAIGAGALLPGSPSNLAGRLLAVTNGAIRLELSGLATGADFEAALATMIRGLRPSDQRPVLSSGSRR